MYHHLLLLYVVLFGGGVAAPDVGDTGDTAASVSPGRRGLFRGRMSRDAGT